MKFLTKLGTISVTFSLLLLAASNTQAATATWSISGNLDLIDQDLQNYFAKGDVISGTMVVEERNGCESGNIITVSCVHFDAVKSLSIQIGSHSFNSNDPSKNGIYSIYNNFDSTVGFLGDDFSLAFARPDSSTTNFGNLTYSNIQLLYRDSTGNSLSSTALTLNPPDASFFDLTQLSLSFYQVVTTNNGIFEIPETIFSYAIGRNLRLSSVSAIPEPESYTLLLAGLGLIGIVSHRRKIGTFETSPRFLTYFQQ